MALSPTPKRHPGYPGQRDLKSVLRVFSWVLVRGATVSCCLAFLLSWNAAYAQIPGQPPAGISAAEESKSPPCRGKVVMDPPPCAGVMIPDPPPCRGDIVSPEPPPCRGEIAFPEPPPPPVYLVTSLSEFYRNSRRWVGRRVRLTAILGRRSDGSLVDQGYYLFDERESNSRGQFLGCPLIGSARGISEGREVTVEGVVTSQRGNPRQSPNGRFYAVQIEQIYVSRYNR